MNVSKDEQGQQMESFVREGARVYINHNFYFKPGFLGAPWQGQWHLAYIQKGWDDQSQSVTVMWSRCVVYDACICFSFPLIHSLYQLSTPRNGRFDCHEIDPDDFEFREFLETKKIPLNIEDDCGTENIHTAHFVEFVPEKPAKIKIRWGNGRKEEIDLSRVCADPSKRKRRATEFLNYNEDFSIKSSKATKKVDVDMESRSSQDDDPVISSKARSARSRKKSAANGKIVLHGFSQSTTQLGDMTFREYLLSLLESMSLHHENSEGMNLIVFPIFLDNGANLLPYYFMLFKNSPIS